MKIYLNKENLVLAMVSIVCLSCQPPSALVYKNQIENEDLGYVYVNEKIRRGYGIDSLKLRMELNGKNTEELKIQYLSGRREKISKNDYNNFFPDSTNTLDKISIQYNQRFTKEEFGFIGTQLFCWAFIFGLVEVMRGPAHETNPRPYNWKIPLFGIGLGMAVSIPLTISKEKKIIHFSWRK